MSEVNISPNNMQTIVWNTYFNYCVSSVEKFRLGTSKCHDCNVYTFHQPIIEIIAYFDRVMLA